MYTVLGSPTSRKDAGGAIGVQIILSEDRRVLTLYWDIKWGKWTVGFSRRLDVHRRPEVDGRNSVDFHEKQGGSELLAFGG